MPQVTVQFAGFIVARTDKQELYIPDVSSLGGPKHAPVLLIRDHSGLRGSPDFVVALPAKPDKSADEYAGWYLTGRVMITGVENKFASSTLVETMDLDKITGAQKLRADRPTAATIHLDNGTLSSFGEPRFYNFFYNNMADKVYPNAISLRDRLSFDLGDMEAPFAITIESGNQRRTITVNPALVEQPLVITSSSAGSRFGSHFEAMADVLDAPARTVTIVRYESDGTTVAATDPPDHEDECYCSKISE